MPNLSKLEAAIPVAPLKLIVMDSARNLGNSVNHYLVNFRKDVKNIAKNDPPFRDMFRIISLRMLHATASVPVKAKQQLTNPSVERIFSFWSMYVTTILLIK